MKKLILILLLITIIIISGCGNKITNDDESSLNDAVERAAKYGAGECDSFSSEELKSRCVEKFNQRVEERNVNINYLKEAVNNKDESKCDAAGEKMGFCKEMYSAMLVFMNGKDKEYCDSISNPSVKLNCFDVYYMHKAVTEDKAYCEQIKDIGIKKGCLE